MQRRGTNSLSLKCGRALLCALLLAVMTLNSPTCLAAEEKQFKKEGELSFFKADREEITRIDIEISDTPAKLERGLMHRSFLPKNAGMLFVYDTPQPLFFWMKNTLISLDIIFAAEGGKIVNIQRHAKPLSEASIRSRGNAEYVVEVNAGFCDSHGIGEGDFVDFKRTGKAD